MSQEFGYWPKLSLDMPRKRFGRGSEFFELLAGHVSVSFGCARGSL